MPPKVNVRRPKKETKIAKRKPRAPAGKPGTKRKKTFESQLKQVDELLERQKILKAEFERRKSIKADVPKKVVAPKKAAKAPAGRPGTKKKEAGERFQKAPAGRSGTKRLTMGQANVRMVDSLNNEKDTLLKLIDAMPAKKYNLQDRMGSTRFWLIHVQPKFNKYRDKLNEVMKKKIWTPVLKETADFHNVALVQSISEPPAEYSKKKADMRKFISNTYDKFIDDLKRKIIFQQASVKLT